MSLLTKYLERVGSNATFGTADQAAAVHFYAALDLIARNSPELATSLLQELRDQRRNMKLIASENFSSLPTQAALGNLFTDKYAEGSVGHRFYAGCDNVDDVERRAASLACELFGAEHAYVQPHSGSDANLIAFIAVLQQRAQEPFLREHDVRSPQTATKNQWNEIRRLFFDKKILAMDYYSGGHLTHGYRFNFSSLLFDAHQYAVTKTSNELDYAAIREIAREVKPLILLMGYSSYPRRINFAKAKEIADEVGATLMVDMAHFAGLVAGKVFTGDYDPVPFADIVTSTTHKTLRGPRGGLVLCKKELSELVDKACPSVAGGPLPHAMLAKAVALKEALSEDFRVYASRIVENAQAFASECLSRGMRIVTNGTDNHMVLIDVHSSFGLTGRQAESALRDCNITLNRNVVPFDVNGPWYTSGLRVGTPAVTTLGMGVSEMAEVADIFQSALSQVTPVEKSQAKFKIGEGAKASARARIGKLMSQFQLYPEINLDVAIEHFGLPGDIID
jgi:glycine hydroxymethyltransferase